MSIANPGVSFFVADLLPLGDSGVNGTVEVLTPSLGLTADTACFVGAASGLEPNLLSVYSGVEDDGAADDCSATNGCGAHIHAGPAAAAADLVPDGCLDAMTQGGHFWNADLLQQDPWLTVGYTSTDADGNAQFAGCVRTGHFTQGLAQRPFILHDNSGARVACGLLRPSVRQRLPSLSAQLDSFGGTTVGGVVTAFSDVSLAVQDAVCVLGNGVELELNLESYQVGGEDCTATNGCGAHIHAGDSCESVETQMGHFYNASAVAVDPWLTAGYHRTNRVGTGFFSECVLTGDTSGYEGRAFLLHANDGSRVACGILSSAAVAVGLTSPPYPAVEPTPAPTVAVDDATDPPTLPDTTTAGVSFFVADLLPLGDSGVNGTVEVLRPVGGPTADTTCFVGAATGLEPNLLTGVGAGAGTDCTATNGCGAHIHEGDINAMDPCLDAMAQGGHFWNPDNLDVDPWLTVGYSSTDAEGNAKFAGCVRTGYFQEGLLLRPFILHDNSGARVACGVLRKAIRPRLPSLSAQLDSFGDASTVSGVVTAFPDVSRAVNDAVCVLGSGVELETDLQSFEVGGTDCAATNGCGAHIHEGMSCESTETQMGHFYNKDVIADDPWLLAGYKRTSSFGTGFFSECVITGETSYQDRAFLLHANDGSRVACGILSTANPPLFPMVTDAPSPATNSTAVPTPATNATAEPTVANTTAVPTPSPTVAATPVPTTPEPTEPVSAAFFSQRDTGSTSLAAVASIVLVLLAVAD